MIRVPAQGVDDRADQLRHDDLLAEGLEAATHNPSGVDELTEDRVHAVGVVDDAVQHQRALLLGHRVPARLEGVAEPLHRGER